MIESIITLLVYVCLLALVIYLIIWVLGIIGVQLPEKVVQIIWVIVALIVVLMILQTVLPKFGVKLALMPAAYAAKGPACESIKSQAQCEAKAGCVWAAPGQSSKLKCMKAKATPRTGVLVPAGPRPLPAPESIPIIAVPPLLMLYDLNRRINCLVPPDPLQLGGPGFSEPMPVGNVMIPCHLRRAGGSPTPTR